MSYSIVLLVACFLSFFFPQFKIASINNFFSVILNFFVKDLIIVEGNIKGVIVVSRIFCIVLLTFVLPIIVFLYAVNFSVILINLIEVFCAYQLLSIPSISYFLARKSNDTTTNASTIIQSIVYFVDNFFIPAFCIAVAGLPLAFMYKAFSYCSKKSLPKDAKLKAINEITNLLYCIPSYTIVLSLFTSSLFFPFCNTKNAFDIYMRDKKKIRPFWLSRILATSFGLLCIQVPVSYIDKNSIITETIGNVSDVITHEKLKALVYVLYSSSIIVIGLMVLCRIIVTWGVW